MCVLCVLSKLCGHCYLSQFSITIAITCCHKLQIECTYASTHTPTHKAFEIYGEFPGWQNPGSHLAPLQNATAFETKMTCTTKGFQLKALAGKSPNWSNRAPGRETTILAGKFPIQPGNSLMPASYLCVAQCDLLLTVTHATMSTLDPSSCGKLSPPKIFVVLHIHGDCLNGRTTLLCASPATRPSRVLCSGRWRGTRNTRTTPRTCARTTT